MGNLVAWLPLVSAVVVCGCCALLLVRGVRHIFITLFGASALIQIVARLAPVLGESALASSRTAVRVLGVISGVGILLFILGWISLTRFMLRSRSTSSEHATSNV
jgi:hypothetical protein